MQDKVLIIEDTRSFALLLQKLLTESLGIDSDIAYSMKEAEDLLQTRATNYFASIVDLNLPDAHKGEAADLVVTKKIPALVFTSTNDQALKEDLWERGIADYASKSGTHSLEYISWIVNRIRKNRDVEVLVVDDSIVACKTMAKLLKTQRYQVHVAKSGSEALKTLYANPNICVAVLDGFMDEMDGFELSALMREKHSRETLEIIGVSSQGGRTLSAQFMKAGANDFLIKPFIPEEFLCRINHAVDRVESYKKLKELNQTKNQLLGTAAHDIRGPVGAIKTAADYIISREPSEERRQTLIKMIQTSSSGLLELLSDLLDVSAIESGEVKLKLTNEDFSKMVVERNSLYKAEAEAKDITITTAIADNVVLKCDGVKLRQVIDNLLTNAIKYSPTDGSIEIKLYNDGNEIVFSVGDSGPGVAEEEQSDLFTPFKVLSSRATGGEKTTGLGLTIANNVVQAHEGEIKYEQSSFGGAQFSVRLPRRK